MLKGTFVLRLGLALVFIYFAVMQFMEPSIYVDYLPASLQGANAEMLVLANAALDAVLAVTILLSIFPRIAPLVGAVHLAGIAFTMGFNDIAARDFGLAMACLALVFIHEERLPWRQRIALNRIFGRH